MGKLIHQTPYTKVFENEDGTYSVHIKRTHNFDGFVESCWNVEIFEEDGIHSGGGYCTHNFPIKYADDGKSLKERALEFAKRYE